jgi:hypothetical protein
MLKPWTHYLRLSSFSVVTTLAMITASMDAHAIMARPNIDTCYCTGAYNSANTGSGGSQCEVYCQTGGPTSGMSHYYYPPAGNNEDCQIAAAEQSVIFCTP